MHLLILKRHMLNESNNILLNNKYLAKVVTFPYKEDPKDTLKIFF